MRFALALGLLALLVTAAGASARDTAQGVQRGFQPEAAAAVGTRNLWVLGGHVLLRSTDSGKHFRRVALPSLPSEDSDPTFEFANAHDGFAYVEDGAPLYVTHDGGTSWHRAGPAGKVVAFALGGGDAYVVSAMSSSGRRSVAAPGGSSRFLRRDCLSRLRLAGRTSGSWGRRVIGPTSTRSRARRIEDERSSLGKALASPNWAGRSSQPRTASSGRFARRAPWPGSRCRRMTAGRSRSARSTTPVEFANRR